MNAHVKIGQEIARQRSLPEIVAEYEAKAQAISDGLRACGKANLDLQTTATLAGVYGDTHLDFKLPSERELHAHLLKSAWLHAYAGVQHRHPLVADR
ncbi:hypothetical protein [Bradyrhizobium sp. 2S1]|uniref:hypothetical protein n=1 Tax=Bradyrhizobium sp. 2S1 TaxID=1404429 RepID=UPI001CD13EEA|nr:hypothetical protein [Bradyrhizobium sp. 2S1]MCK7669141.1 hypothetical protein [Bradyrhizobium sp. 2S1]